MTQEEGCYLEPAGHYCVSGTSKGGDAISSLLASRREILGRSADRLVNLLEGRNRLRENSLASIDENRLTVANLIHALYRPAQPVTDNPLYFRLKLETLRLDRDERMEAVGAWRDALETEKELGELVEKIEQARRNELLTGGGQR